MSSRPLLTLWLGALLLGAAQTGASEPCRAAAVVDGGAAEEVRAALAARGVAALAEPRRDCVPVRASVEPRTDGIEVDLTDGTGRHVVRRVATTTSAATVIESWARPDLTEPLIERADAIPAAPAGDAAGAPWRRPMLAAAAELSLASDGSLWAGARISGCAFIGPVCAGVALRLDDDDGWRGVNARIGGARFGADMLVLVDLPSRARGFVLTPGLAFGLGWIRSHSREADGDVVELDWQGPRADAHIALSTPLAGGVWFYAVASATLLPLADTATRMHDGATVAAEPRGFFGLAIGLSSAQAP